MRVGLDLTPAVVGTTGVRRYAEELWRGLVAEAAIDVSAFTAGRTARRLPGVRHLPVPVRLLDLAWRRTGRPRAETLLGELDVVHSLDLTPPPSAAPLVVSLLDVLPATHPEFFSARSRAAHAAKLAAVERAAVVVTITEAAARDIVALGLATRDRILVSPLGGRGGAGAAPVAPAVAPPYVLALGALTPRKGFDVLAQAAVELGPASPKVVIAGPDGYRAGEVRAALRAARRAGADIRVLDELSDGTVAALLAHATLVCHPSRAEGFGLVALEAMEHGVPVVAADIPAVREVVGDAAVLVPVDDPTALAAAMAALMEEGQRRTALSSAGRARAAAFGWPLLISTCIEAYRMAVRT